MATQLTADDAKQSLTAHVATKGDEICAKYGPGLGWKELQQLLQEHLLKNHQVSERLEHPIQNQMHQSVKHAFRKIY